MFNNLKAVLLIVFFLAGSAPAFAQQFRNDVEVLRVSRAREFTDETLGHKVSRKGETFVLIDCRFGKGAHVTQLDDIQLVKSEAAPDEEESLGDNFQDDYLYWLPINRSGKVVTEINSTPSGTFIRLIFRIPESAKQGYLFYRGQYWGPVNLGE